MKLIVGLGNYPREYHETRHNAGFMVIDYWLNQHHLTLKENKFNGWFIKTNINNQQVIIAKPYTYMNLSGQFVRDIMNFYKISINDLLVIADDVDTPIGSIRIKTTGSSAGQKGIQNIIDLLGTKDFKRIRVGIDKPSDKSQMISFVTGKFTRQERTLLDPMIEKSASVIDTWLETDDFNLVLNKFN